MARFEAKSEGSVKRQKRRVENETKRETRGLCGRYTLGIRNVRPTFQKDY